VIDILTLALTHGLMALAALVLVTRGDLDDDAAAPDVPKRWQRRADLPAPGSLAED
jgi:hypothetical protein